MVWWLSVSCFRLHMADIGARFAHRRLSTIPVSLKPCSQQRHRRQKWKRIYPGNATLVRNNPNQLQPPDAGKSATPLGSSCGFDPRTGQPYRFNPETGQACSGYPQDRVVVRQPAASRALRINCMLLNPRLAIISIAWSPSWIGNCSRAVRRASSSPKREASCTGTPRQSCGMSKLPSRTP